MKVLVVDDEPKIVEIVTAYLQKAGYMVESTDSGTQALEMAQSHDVDLVVLDLMLPDMNGLEVAQLLRETRHVPIIMLTARSSEADVIKGLRTGADDYIIKPFSPRILVARVESVLRRQVPNHADEICTDDGKIKVNLMTREVRCHGETIELTKTEFDLLEVMIRHPKQIFSREQLIQTTRGIDYEGMDRMIDSHIKNLRKKLEVDPKSPHYIKTATGSGYFFTEVSA